MLIGKRYFQNLCLQCIFIYSSGTSFAMLSLNNASTTNNPTNETGCDNDCLNFLKQLFLADQILFIVIMILIIMGNTLVLLATWRERSLHQPNKYFIACLAVADLLVGIFIGPVRVYRLTEDYTSRRDMSIHFCRFMVWIDTLVVTASVYTLMFISFDRYLKISKPLQYRSRMTTSKSLKIIFIIWLISTAFATYAAIPDSGSTGFLADGGGFCPDVYLIGTWSKIKRYVTFLFISVIYLSAIVIMIMYACIFVVAHKQQRMLRNGELGETSTGQNQRSVLRQDLKIVRMLLIVVGVFFFCWLPYSITTFLYTYNPNAFGWSLRSHIIYGWIIYVLPLINSLCNPIIYACLDQTYREAFKHLLQKKMFRTRSNTQQPPSLIELHPLRNV